MDIGGFGLAGDKISHNFLCRFMAVIFPPSFLGREQERAQKSDLEVVGGTLGLE